MKAEHLAYCTIDGWLLWIEICFGIAAAIFFINLLDESASMVNWARSFQKLHPDQRVQAIYIGWLLTSFLQALFGFALASVVGSVLLTALKFPGTCARMIILIGLVTGTPFSGMAGALNIGLRKILDYPDLLLALSRGNLTTGWYMQQISTNMAILSGILGFFVPLCMILPITLNFSWKRFWKLTLSITPFALLAGATFVIPYALTAIYLGPQWPNLIGGLTALIICFIFIKARLFMPKENWQFEGEREWPEWWQGKTKNRSDKSIPIWKAWAPFVLLTLSLVVVNVPQLGLKSLLASTSFIWRDVFHTGHSTSFQLLSGSGFIFLLISFITVIIRNISKDQILSAVKRSFTPIAGLTSFFVFGLPIANIYNYMPYHPNDVTGFSKALADAAASSFLAKIWPIFNPILGSIGSHISNIDIASNYALIPFQFQVAENLLLPSTMMIALQTIGATVNVAITRPLIQFAEPFIGLEGKQKEIWLKLFPFYAIYIALIGLLAFIAIHYFHL